MMKRSLILPAMAAGLLLPYAPAIIKPAKDWAAHEKMLLANFLPGMMPSWNRAVASSETETFFDSGDKDSSITLSGSDKIATKSGTGWSNSSVGTTTSRNSGARYAELYLNTAGSAFGVGFTLADAGLVANTRGSTPPGHAVYVHGGSESAKYVTGYGGHATPASGTRWWDGTDYSNTLGGTATTTGQVMGIGIDITNGKLWSRINGTWGNSASPAVNGTDWHFIDRVPQTTGGYTLVVTLYGDTYQVTLRTKSSEFSGSVPSGFTAWDNGV